MQPSAPAQYPEPLSKGYDSPDPAAIKKANGSKWWPIQRWGPVQGITAAVVVVGGILVATAIEGSTSGGRSATSTAAPSASDRACPGSAVEVGYFADGSAMRGSVTMEMSDGGKQGDVSLPMKNKLGDLGLRFCADRDDFFYISVQNMGESGTVRCQIKVDGVVVADNESSGAYSIASCDE